MFKNLRLCKILINPIQIGNIPFLDTSLVLSSKNNKSWHFYPSAAQAKFAVALRPPETDFLQICQEIPPIDPLSI